jgi:protocatechuate 3,4-dioxygenase beta subunit
MPASGSPDETRRRLVRALLAVPAALSAAPLLGLATCAEPARQAALSRPPTPTCDDGDDPTPPQTEGPFFTPDSPARTSLLEAGLGGTALVVTGRVLTRSCQPVPGALLDFWHTDDAGAYDNEGFRLRGHQFTDAEGRFRLETIVPGRYPGRTRHVHVKAQAPNERVLTTQLYFPDEPQNATDGLFHEACLMEVVETAEGRQATFDFILDLA